MAEPLTMSSSKPYLIRAIYDWIIDNDMTPYIVIDANAKSVQVPTEFIDDGRIILNISPMACRGLHLENDRVVFTARFSGVAQQIYAPPGAVLAIYAKETGRGMVFAEDGEFTDQGEQDAAGPSSKSTTSKGGSAVKKARPNLKVVK